MVAGALRAQGLTVVTHDDVFPPGTPDVEWLARAGAEHWVVITKDTRIRYHDSERAALLHSGVRAFVLRGGNLTGPQMADAVLRARSRMDRLLRRRRGAFIASITSRGGVEILYS